MTNSRSAVARPTSGGRAWSICPISCARVSPRARAASPTTRQNASSNDTEVRCPSIVTDRFIGGVMGGRSIVIRAIVAPMRVKAARGTLPLRLTGIAEKL